MKDLAFYSELINQIDTLTFNHNKMVASAKFFATKTPLKVAGLNLIEQMVLRYIYLYGPFSMSTLSNLANLKPSYLSRVTENLLKRGFCEKNQSKCDQRVYNISLTETGYSMTKEHVESLRQNFLQKFVSYLNESEIELFKNKLLLIVEYLSSSMERLGFWRETSTGDIYTYDLFELMDKRSKCANKLILHFSAEKRLPFFIENFNYFQNNIIFHLFLSGAMSISSLSRLTGFKLKHLSGTLKGLEARGIIFKTQDSIDKRVHYVELSERGKYLAATQECLEKQCYIDYFNTAFSASELDEFFSAHQIVNQIFERF